MASTTNVLPQVATRLVFLILFDVAVILAFLDIDELNSVNYGIEISNEPILLPQESPATSVDIKSKYGQQYHCKYPDHQQQGKQTEHNERVAIETGIPELLKPLANKSCLFNTKDWWTYEFCFGKYIRQYHLEADSVEKSSTVPQYTYLGYFESEYQWYNRTHEETLVRNHHIQNHYHSQWYVNGSRCDLSGKLRKAEVRFMCEKDSVDYIGFIDEPETCVYTLTVYTSVICNHPYLKPPALKKPVPIVCNPVLAQHQLDKYLQRKQNEEKKKISQTEEQVKGIDSIKVTENGKDVDIKIIIIDNPTAYNMLSLVKKSFSKDATTSHISNSNKAKHYATSKRPTWPFLLPKGSAAKSREIKEEEENVKKSHREKEEVKSKELKQKTVENNSKGERESKEESNFHQHSYKKSNKPLNDDLHNDIQDHHQQHHQNHQEHQHQQQEPHHHYHHHQQQQHRQESQHQQQDQQQHQQQEKQHQQQEKQQHQQQQEQHHHQQQQEPHHQQQQEPHHYQQQEPHHQQQQEPHHQQQQEPHHQQQQEPHHHQQQEPHHQQQKEPQHQQQQEPHHHQQQEPHHHQQEQQHYQQQQEPHHQQQQEEQHQQETLHQQQEPHLHHHHQQQEPNLHHHLHQQQEPNLHQQQEPQHQQQDPEQQQHEHEKLVSHYLANEMNKVKYLIKDYLNHVKDVDDPFSMKSAAKDGTEHPHSESDNLNKDPLTDTASDAALSDGGLDGSTDEDGGTPKTAANNDDDDDELTSPDKDSSVKVRVSKLGDGGAVTDEDSKDSNKLLDSVKEGLEKAGIQLPGDKVKVRIFSTGFSGKNSIKMSAEEVDAVKNMVITVLGDNQQLQKENEKQKQLEENYSFVWKDDDGDDEDDDGNGSDNDGNTQDQGTDTETPDSST
ncbi:hypothetical protein Ahia01_000337600 [Argonauta hians]